MNTIEETKEIECINENAVYIKTIFPNQNNYTLIDINDIKVATPLQQVKYGKKQEDFYIVAIDWAIETDPQLQVLMSADDFKFVKDNNK